METMTTNGDWQTVDRGHSIEDTGLAVRDDFGAELATSREAALAQHEIQSSLVIAKKFPRNEDQCYQRLMRSCKRTSFADLCEYRFPRGQTNVIGPTVYLAREAARLWGNVRYGADVIRDDDEQRIVRCWAWDMETNTRVSSDAPFKKLVQRKNKNTQRTEWVVPDERDLRELTNKHAAVGVRNCLLQILPRDVIDDARAMSHETKRAGAAQDPNAARKSVIAAFDRINVTVEMIETYLTHPLSQASPDQIADLRGIWKAISDGQARWVDYVSESEPDEKPKSGSIDPATLKASDSKNRGHGKEGFDAKPTTPAASASTDPHELSDAERAEIARREAADWEAAKKGGAK